MKTYQIEKLYIFFLISALCFARLSVPVGHVMYGLGTISGGYLIYRNRHRIEIPEYWYRYMSFWVIFLLCSVPSLVLVGHFLPGIKGLVYLYMYPVVPFFCMPLCIKNKRYIYYLLAAFFAVTAVDVLVSFYQVGWLGIRQGEGFRGPILSLAGILLMALIIGIYISTSLHFPLWLRRMAQASIFFSIVGLMTNRSRALWILFPFTLCMGFGKRFLVKLLILCLAFGFTVITYETVPVIQHRLNSSIDISKNESNLGRIYIWTSTIHMIKDHPVLGVGINQYKEGLDKGYRLPQETEHLNQAHNNFLQVVAEEGFIGGLGFVVFLLGFIYTSFYLALKKDVPFIAMIGALILFYLVLFGQIEHTILRVPGLRTMWILSGAFYTLYVIRRKEVITQGR